MNRQGHGVELVDDLEARFLAEVVHARNIEQVIERKLVAAKLGHFAQILARNDEGGLATKFRLLVKFGAEKLA